MKIIHDINKTNLDANKRIYQCETCGKLFNWDCDSSWYGSYNQIENQPDEVKYYCSDECARICQNNINQKKMKKLKTKVDSDFIFIDAKDEQEAREVESHINNLVKSGRAVISRGAVARMVADAEAFGKAIRERDKHLKAAEESIKRVVR